MATVTRVLPWRRGPNRSTSAEIAGLLAAFEQHHPKADTSLIERAFELAARAHEGQYRKSGEPYIRHPVAVATIVARQGIDDITIAGALLHDAVEDTSVGLAQLEKEFGPEVAKIVDGVTKLERVKYDTKELQQAATMRKMIVAIASDMRVLIIKLADRLHNLSTIAALPAFKQERSARETLDVYAPLAHRLGMQEMKWQLEDLSFAALHPRRYAEIDQMIQQRAPERDLYLAQVLGDVQARLAELGIVAQIDGRPKHLWSVYEKMVVKGRGFDEIFDLVGIRVIVDSVRECYGALGSIHATWRPVQGRFKDYIAMPKFNLYQSLHTTVVGPQGKSIEVQIRTREMHQRAEFGVAAHSDYKDGEAGSEMAWLNRIVEWQQETSDPSEFMNNLKFDLDQDEVYVFTPKGKVVELPVGATPVDFAYTIHTDVGHSCIGSKVNGRLVPLNSRLESGDSVEIFTSKVEGAGPSRDWLKFVASRRAANKIKQWYTRERREDAIEHGRDEVLAALRRAGLPAQRIVKEPVFLLVGEQLNYTDEESLFAAVGEGHVAGSTIAERVTKELRGEDLSADEEQARLPANVSRRLGTKRRATGSAGVHVEGLDDIMIRISRCCSPVPPDEIIGFVTRGRGVSVHRADCLNATTLQEGQPDRLIEVEWDADHDGRFATTIELQALDRNLLLVDVAKVLSDHGLNVISVATETGDDAVAKMQFEFELADVSQLDSVLSRLLAVEAVYDAYRLVPGGGASDTD
ncbi:MAG: bifunctional (p)ppGpp synthetase/guanosine-3',5'-bis(diphosphate) 3'-pyrophosphohydrolase [Acidimicrobiales bacterium]